MTARARSSFRLAAAVLIACVLVLSLALRVAVGFQGVRVKAVRAPQTPTHGEVTTSLRSLEALASHPPPYVAIWAVRNASPDPASFSLTIGRTEACAREVGPRSLRWLDCVIRGPLTPTPEPETLMVRGPASAWVLDYAELSTHRGGSRRFPEFFVVPKGKPYARPDPWLIAAASVLMGALIFLPGRPPSRVWRAHAVASVAASGLLLLVLVSPWLSGYEVVVAPGTWLIIAVVIAAPRLVTAGAAIASRVTPGARPRRLLGVSAVALVAAAVAARVSATSLELSHEGNYSGRVRIAAARADAHPILRERHDLARSLRVQSDTGYDAQFSYFMAFDPFLRDFTASPDRYEAFIDAPPYRYGRIGFPLLTRAVSLGRPEAYPWAMVWLVVAGISASAAVFGLIARHFQASVWWGLSVLAIPGFWTSLEFALPEPIALAFLLAGYLAALHRRWFPGGMLLAIALLIRETGAVFAAVLALALIGRGDRRGAIWILIIACAPLIVWRVYMWSVLGPVWGASALFFNPDIHDPPLAGLLQLFDRLRAGAYGESAISNAARWYAWLLSGAVVLGCVAAVRLRSVPAAAAMVYGLLALCLAFDRMWEHVGNVERVTSDVFVFGCLALAVAPGRLRWTRATGGVLLGACAAYVLYGSLEAPFIQSALLGVSP